MKSKYKNLYVFLYNANIASRHRRSSHKLKLNFMETLSYSLKLKLTNWKLRTECFAVCLRAIKPNII